MASATRERFKVVHGGQANTSIVETATPLEDLTTVSMDVFSEQDQWLARVSYRLAEIDGLQRGWDGYGSERVPTPTLYFAAMLLANVWAEASLLSFPTIGPMSNGAIMIEWRTGTHELTVEVNNPNDVDVLFETLGTGQTSEFHVTSDFAKISEALESSTKSVYVAVA